MTAIPSPRLRDQRSDREHALKLIKVDYEVLPH